MRRTLTAVALVAVLVAGCASDDTEPGTGTPADADTTTSTAAGDAADDVIAAAGTRVADITSGRSAENPSADPAGPCPIMSFDTLADIVGVAPTADTEVAELDGTLRCLLRNDANPTVAFQVSTDMGTIARYREVPLSEDIEPVTAAGGELSAFCGNPDECYAFWTAPDGTWNLYLSTGADAATDAATLEEHLAELLAAVAAG